MTVGSIFPFTKPGFFRHPVFLTHSQISRGVVLPNLISQARGDGVLKEFDQGCSDFHHDFGDSLNACFMEFRREELLVLGCYLGFRSLLEAPRGDSAARC